MEDVILLQQSSDHNVDARASDNALPIAATPTNPQPQQIQYQPTEVKIINDELVLKLNRLEYAAQLLVGELSGLKQELRNRGYRL